MRTRLKIGLMKKLGRRHLDLPKGGEGNHPGDAAALVRGRRPSIAPVPAMFGQEDSSEEGEDDEEESSSPEKEEREAKEQEEQRKEEDEEKYLDIQWVTPAENCE